MMGAPTRHRGRSRYPTRSRNAGATGAAPATFNPLTDWTTDPVHGVWASDPLWTPPADAGAVSSWRNGGSVGGDLVQATGSKQPTYRASTAAFNNRPTVQFDGTDDALAVDIADVAQPFYLLVIGNTAGGTGLERLVGIGGGEAASNGAGFGDNSFGTYSLRAGAPTLTGGSTNASPHLFRSTYNGASSVLSVDGAATASGTTGTGAAEVFVLGAASDATLSAFSYHLNGSIAYAALFTTDPSGQAEWSTFKAWVTSFYGITVA